jgi:cobalt-zinc-cadmium efflux system protein
LGLSLFVAWLARQSGSSAKTYGYLRWEILAALINGATLLLISVWIIIEAMLRFKNPEPVQGGVMLVVALIGFGVNGIAVWLLHGVRDGSLNVRGAYLHVLGDMLASGGTVVAAIIIRMTGWLGADPVASLVTTLLIVSGAWRLVRESVDVLLEAAPAHIALDAVRTRLEAVVRRRVHSRLACVDGDVRNGGHERPRHRSRVERPPIGAGAGARPAGDDGHPPRDDSARV